MDVDLTNESAELLSELIRNACVNDGTRESGQESRNAELLISHMEGAGLDFQRFESVPGRASLVARIEGSDPTAPTLCLMGHTDVVPVNPDGWSRDPFGGEIVDGEIWGRGAIDMLNLTATQAVAFKHLAKSGFKPKGTLIFFAVADEEAGGTYGAKWMVDNHYDVIGADYVLTEMGGIAMPTSQGTKVTVAVGEKGLRWRRLKVTGTPGHGSMPYGADNALIRAAEVVRRLSEYRPAARLDEIWAAKVAAHEFPTEIAAGLLDRDRVYETLGQMEPTQAKALHACVHTTFSPNVVHGGIKTNVIPDTVEIDVDIRSVPGDGPEEIEAHLREALGADLADQVEVEPLFDDEATVSPINNPLWDMLGKVARERYPDAELLPELLFGATDSRFYRNKGAIAYGTGLYEPEVTFEQWASRFHGDDERIDIKSLGLCSNLWLRAAEELLL